MYIDTHAHVHDRKFDADRDTVMQRAFEGGVKKIVLVGTSIQESKDALALAKKYEGLWVIVAVHPHEYAALEDDVKSLVTIKQWNDELNVLIQQEKVIGIGECGLDYYPHGGRPVSEKQKILQLTGFKGHIKLAITSQLPLIIHCRASSVTSDDAYEELLRVLGAYQSRLSAVVLHCYQGGVEVTKKFLDLPGIYFSFSGTITYPVKKALQGSQYESSEVVRIVPLDRIVSETDCPYLAPQEYRGSRNEPLYVKAVVKKIAEIHHVSELDVMHAIEENAKKALKI